MTGVACAHQPTCLSRQTADVCPNASPAARSISALQVSKASADEALAKGRSHTALSALRLSLSAACFTPTVAASAAVAFPGATSLQLCSVMKDPPSDLGLLPESMAAFCCVAGGVMRISAMSLPLCELTPSLGDVLAALPRLSSLSVSGVTLWEEGGVTAAQLARLTQLRSLTLGVCSSFGLCPLLKMLPNLRSSSFGRAASGRAASLTHPAAQSYRRFSSCEWTT